MEYMVKQRGLQGRPYLLASAFVHDNPKLSFALNRQCKFLRLVLLVDWLM